MQVCVPSTPAQIFHLLRRQLIRPYRKPLIVMTPKSFLRHPLAVSSLEDLATDGYKTIIPEIDALNQNKIKRLVLCCGKVYYDLLEKRRKDKITEVAIARIEQLYPFPEKEFATLINNYKHTKEIFWCQEEPENQGAWDAIRPFLLSGLSKEQKLRYAGRTASASPAVGYAATHVQEQETLVKQALSE